MPAKNKQKTYQEDLESNSVLVQGEVLGLRLTDVVQNSLFTFCDPQAASLPPLNLNPSVKWTLIYNTVVLSIQQETSLGGVSDT